MPQHEITSRIRRDELLELLETEAPMQDQRITARMPAVTLTDLLRIPDDPVPPPPDRGTLEPPTAPRPYVRAKGTDQAIKALEADPSLASALAGALDALMSADEPPALIVDRAPIDTAPPRTRRGRATSWSETFDPLDAREIATVLDRLHEADEAAEPAAPPARAAPTPRPSSPMPTPAGPAALSPAVVALQLSTLATPFPRALVIAASCTLTLMLALLISLL